MLPSPWVDRLFDRLALVYGRSFSGKWDGLDLNVVKADWAHELAGFADKPDALRYAIDHLPAYPPNVVEFRNLARLAPPAPVKALPEPKADPQRVAQAMSQVQVRHDLRSPSQRVVDGLLAADKLSLAQRQMLASCRTVLSGDDPRLEAIDARIGHREAA